MSEAMTLIRKVAVRSIVTPALREELQVQVKKILQDLELKMVALEKAKEATLDNKGKGAKNSEDRLLSGLASEMAKLESHKKEVQAKGQEYQQLKDGALFFQGTIDSLVQIQLGDILDDKVNGGEIIIKDGEIIEINSV